jgi:hypothetical protein
MLKAHRSFAATLALVLFSGSANAQPQSSGAPRQGPAPQRAEEDTPLLQRFDRNGNKRLDRAERDSARRSARVEMV